MNFLKNITFIISFYNCISLAQLAFLPFENKSNFEGNWELKTEIPNFIAAYLRETDGWSVIGSTTFLSMSDNNVALHDLELVSKFLKENNLRFSCGGRVEVFSLTRYMLGEPTLAGYEGYSSSIKINVFLFDALSEKIFFNETIESTINRNGIGINLFGKPTTEKEQFYGLNSISFGSEEFNHSIVGENFNLLLEKLAEKLALLKKGIRDELKGEQSFSDTSIARYKLKSKIVQGEILMYDSDTGEAFVNIGSNDDVKLNDLLSVYSASDSLFDPKTGYFLGVAEKKIAELQIAEIRGEGLSLALANEESKKIISKGMIVKKIDR